MQIGRHFSARCSFMAGEEVLVDKEFAVGTFYDIIETFNNMRMEAVIKALKEF